MIAWLNSNPGWVFFGALALVTLGYLITGRIDDDE